MNTGPLVSFARIGCLDVIGSLPYEFLCPAEAVIQLALDLGVRTVAIDEWKGRRGASKIRVASWETNQRSWD